ncbi:thioredoxin-disulfide reductase [Blattabacterium cuenoti]|uniref:thioredoxin-disulfide reductase n=1 Tax=Blattabacterium cuenoti TaxID=1653831 RepID=UPI00163C6E56|nr:thioredoxin-disulfide reductase [Blattabacterium cuenoti]
MSNINKCIIIGSGPAGYSAAVYASRADMNPILISGPKPGGQLIDTNDVDNYLGFYKGINGKELMDHCEKHARRFHTEIINQSVINVIFSKKIGGIHKIFIDDHQKFLSTFGVIIATGSRPNFLGLKKEKEFIGLGISFCATCDGFFHKKKCVSVVGGGDTALEEALYLSKICKKVYLIVRKNFFKASKILQKQIYKKHNVEICFDSIVQEIIGNEYLEGIKILNKKKKIQKTIFISGLFIAIGHVPNTEIFENQIELDKNNFIVVKHPKNSTNKPGVFASGDVVDFRYRQAITAASSGCISALELDRYLSSF